jgi:hypothetical protein
MIKRLERLKHTVNKYVADIRPDRLTTCQSEQKSVVSRRPTFTIIIYKQHISTRVRSGLKSSPQLGEL